MLIGDVFYYHRNRDGSWTQDPGFDSDIPRPNPKKLRANEVAVWRNTNGDGHSEVFGRRKREFVEWDDAQE